MKYDIIIIGAGPAGLTAAIYARRAGKTVLVLEKGAFGGQITFSPKVENIPGTAEISGNDFATALIDQVISLGADLEPAEVTGISINSDGSKTVASDLGEYTGVAVIIASGARHRSLGIPGEERFIGSGISFCAVCDGAFYKDKTVGVVGGGNSAMQEALLLSETCQKVIIIQNLDFLTGETTLEDRLMKKKNIELKLGSVVCGFDGSDKLTGVKVKSAVGEENIELDGLFIAIGLEPQNEIFSDLIELDDLGYASSGEDCLTKTPGIFVAGDCRKKKVRQVTTACSDGAIAALAACEYCEQVK